MPMGKGVSILAVDEAFASGDSRFLMLLRGCYDAKGLARLVNLWNTDHRPWARQQAMMYMGLPFDVPGHEVVVKRVFKHGIAQQDHELVGVCMVAFDRLARRRRTRKYSWDWRTSTGQEYWTMKSLHHNRIPQNALGSAGLGDSIQRRRLRLFSYHTRYFLRRWAWRFFRLMGRQRPELYPTAMARVLARYRDEDLNEGQAVLDSWGLMHACFGKSPGVRFSVRHADLTRENSLDEMVRPFFEELWRGPASATTLLELTLSAQSRVVRMWSSKLIRRHHLQGLTTIGVDQLLTLLDHGDPEVQALGALLLDNAPSLDQLDVDSWLRLLQTKNVTILASIAAAMRKHVGPERLTLEQAVAIACARPAPVAQMGLEMLGGRSIATEPERQAIARLSTAQCATLGGAITAWALSILGPGAFYSTEHVIGFFDSRVAGVREGAWAWLTPESAGWTDAVLWSRLLETPYDDVRLRLVKAMESRAVKPVKRPAFGDNPEELASLWCAVLLGIQRGGRSKLIALGQISDALERWPDRAAVLMPVLAVAVRSVRAPEARRGLAAIVQALEKRPELGNLVREHFPEMRIEEVAR